MREPVPDIRLPSVTYKSSPAASLRGHTKNSPMPQLATAADAQHDIADSQDAALQAFVERHERLFVLTGAGCSTASGLGDYRDSNGAWKRSQPMTGQLFKSSAQGRRRYWARSAIGWPMFRSAEPNACHHALADLQLHGSVVHLVTQNVDRLHQAAGHGGVIDLHGVLATVSCIACGWRLERDRFQHRLLEDNPWLAELSASHAPDGDADLEHPSIASLTIPPCEACSGILKPDVVFFGENVPKPRVDQAMHQLRSADALLVIGSSLMVYSGYRFCREAAATGKPIALVNEGITRADDLAALKVGGDCGQRMARLQAALGA